MNSPYIYYEETSSITLYETVDENIITEYLPKIKNLSLSHNFNAFIDFSKFDNIERLFIYNGSYNQSLDNLPKNLEELYIRNEKSMSIDNLPSNLKGLYIRGNLPMLDFLPQSLEKLSLNCSMESRKYTKNIFNNLPKIKQMLIFMYYGEPFIEILPDSIEELYIDLYKYPITKLPKNLKYFSFKSLFSYYHYDLPKGNYIIDDSYNGSKICKYSFFIL